jgi:hypothetical protein
MCRLLLSFNVQVDGAHATSALMHCMACQARLSAVVNAAARKDEFSKPERSHACCFLQAATRVVGATALLQSGDGDWWAMLSVVTQLLLDEELPHDH